jgi:CBS-domain-containing membrane protein
MKEVLARDIMIPLDKYPHIPYWFTLRQAIAEMENFQLDVDGRRSLPRFVLVFDETYQLLGIVRRRDIMRGLEPRFLVSSKQKSGSTTFGVRADPHLTELSSGAIIEAMREQAERPVSEIMNAIAATVQHDDQLPKIVYECVENDISLLPVLQDEQVVGVVRTVDVLHELGKIIL